MQSGNRANTPGDRLSVSLFLFLSLLTQKQQQNKKGMEERQQDTAHRHEQSYGETARAHEGRQTREHQTRENTLRHESCSRDREHTRQPASNNLESLEEKENIRSN